MDHAAFQGRTSPSSLTVVAEALSLSVSLVPEHGVTDLDSSLAFYVRLIVFERRHERFSYLALDCARLMLRVQTVRVGDSAPLLWLTHSRGALRREDG